MERCHSTRSPGRKHRSRSSQAQVVLHGVSLKGLTDDRVCKAWLYPDPKAPLHMCLRPGAGCMARARRRPTRDWFLQSSGKEACSKEPAARQPFQDAIFVSTREQAFQGPAGCVLIFWWLWFNLRTFPREHLHHQWPQLHLLHRGLEGPPSSCVLPWALSLRTSVPFRVLYVCRVSILTIAQHSVTFPV